MTESSFDLSESILANLSLNDYEGTTNKETRDWTFSNCTSPGITSDTITSDCLSSLSLTRSLSLLSSDGSTRSQISSLEYDQNVMESNVKRNELINDERTKLENGASNEINVSTKAKIFSAQLKEFNHLMEKQNDYIKRLQKELTRLEKIERLFLKMKFKCRKRIRGDSHSRVEHKTSLTKSDLLENCNQITLPKKLCNLSQDMSCNETSSKTKFALNESIKKNETLLENSNCSDSSTDTSEITKSQSGITYSNCEFCKLHKTFKISSKILSRPEVSDWQNIKRKKQHFEVERMKATSPNMQLKYGSDRNNENALKKNENFNKFHCQSDIKKGLNSFNKNITIPLNRPYMEQTFSSLHKENPFLRCKRSISWSISPPNSYNLVSNRGNYINSLSLQDAFKKRHPDVLKKSKLRFQAINAKADIRRKIAEYRLLDSNYSDTGKNIIVKPNTISCKTRRLLTDKEMRFQTQKKYYSLPEVRQRNEKMKKEEEAKSNRIIAEQFSTCLRKSALKGRVSFPLSQKLSYY